MTKVIKEEFEKLESLKISDDSLTCNISLENFHKEFNRMSRMDNDLFTYEVEIHGSDDDIEYDQSDIEFTEWLASKFYNHKIIDQYTKNALWIYWTRGNDEVELLDEESSDSDNEDEVAKIFRIDTNVFDFEALTYKAFKEFNYLLQIDPDVLTKDIDGFKTYEEYKDDWIYEWNKDIQWVHEKPWTNNGIWEEPTPVEHYYEPFSFKSGHMEWPTCNWKDEGYCNEGHLLGAYIVGNTLRYQDLEWYEGLEDGKLKDEALKNKAIMEGIIDKDDESHNKGWRRWDGYKNAIHDHEERKNKEEHGNEERCELFDNPHHDAPVCNIRRFEMIKYSFGEDEEYVAIKEHEYDDLTSTNKDACHTYQEIFRMMNEGWMATRAK
ncbi:hypothetical protein Tco_1513683 [Tanacetum coccineum]